MRDMFEKQLKEQHMATKASQPTDAGQIVTVKVKRRLKTDEAKSLVTVKVKRRPKTEKSNSLKIPGR